MKIGIESAERIRAHIVVTHSCGPCTIVILAVVPDPVCIMLSDECKRAAALHKYLSRDRWRGGGFAVVYEVCILGLVCQLLLGSRHCRVQGRHAGYAAPRRQRGRRIKEGVACLLRLLRLVPAHITTTARTRLVDCTSARSGPSIDDTRDLHMTLHILCMTEEISFPFQRVKKDTVYSI